MIGVSLSEGTGTQSATTLFVDARYDLYGSLGNMGTLVGKTSLDDWDIDGAQPTAVVESEDGMYKLTVSNTSPAVVKYVENRTSVTSEGFLSNELTITYV